jgi:sodium-dependent phosphate transporter
MVELYDDSWLWIVIVGFLIAFILSLGIGSNDVANTFGTSVGSKVLTLRQACILASIFETLGAILLGAKVSDTVRKGVIDTAPYENDTELFMVGNIAALGGSCVWLFTATFLSMPVSATHSIIGAIVGFSLVAKGSKGIDWVQLGMIVASWFVSPVLSGIITILIFMVVKYFILNKKDPLEPGLRFLPIFYSLTIVLNAFSIFYDGPEMLGFDRIPLWGVFVLAFGAGTICALLIRILLVPWQRKKIISDIAKVNLEREEEGGGKIPLEDLTSDGVHNNGYSTDKSRENLNNVNGQAFTTDGSGKPFETSQVDIYKGEKSLDDKDGEDTTEDTDAPPKVVDRPETARLFSFLQILTAIFGAFAHGGNDVSNAIGPLVSIWLISTDPNGDVAGEAQTPVWLLLIGGVGISVGLWIWGRRVIKTMGEDLTTITPSSGFAIETGAAITVLIASNLGIPISSTHCKVGSIIFVGRYRSKENVDWSLFRNIALSWVLTLPISGAFAAAFMALLQLAV